MPTYQYSCTECGHFFEQFQSFSEDSLTVCPQCQGRLRKVFNAVGVVFKGSGFYKTDSRGSKGSSAEGTKTETKAESGSGDKAAAATSNGAKDSSSSATPAPAAPASKSA